MQLYSILLCFVHLKLLTRLNIFLQTSYKYVFCILCSLCHCQLFSWVMGSGLGFFFPLHICVCLLYKNDANLFSVAFTVDIFLKSLPLHFVIFFKCV